MPPNLGRFAERLTCLSHAELVVLAARGCVADELARREADRLIAARQPTPPWIVDVLMHRDLLPQFLLCLDPHKDGDAALVCREWARAWAVRTRRVLRWAELPDLPPLPDVHWKPSCLAALPDGRLAILNDVHPDAGNGPVAGNDIHIVNSNFQRVATIYVDQDVAAMVAGDGGLYVSTYRSEFGHGVAHHEYHLLRYEYRSIPSLLLPPSNIVPVKARAELHEMMSYLAVGDGAVWCMGETRVYRFDARTLESGFQFEAGGDPRPGAMTVHANELYIAFRGDRLQPYTIKVYSFGGQVIRSFTVPSSHTELNDREPLELYSARDRLYLSETVPDARTRGRGAIVSEIFVLNAEGTLLEKIESGDREQFPYMCVFDDKLLLTKMTDPDPNPDDDDFNERNEVVALKGL